MRGSSMVDIGARNELVVLDAIRSDPDGSSQSEVIRRSGLSRQAVSLITRRLLERGIVETAGTLGGARGKPRTLLKVVPTALLAAGVHLDPSGIAIAIVDLEARVVAEETLPAPTTDPEADVARIAAGLDAVLDRLEQEGWRAPDGGTPAETLLGIGVASPGSLDARLGLVESPPWLPGWRDVPLTELLGAATGRPVMLDKDTNAALTAELWSGRRTVEGTVLYLYVGAGVGSAVASGGRVRAGATTQAGEIGHLPTGLPGTRCGCGRLACLSMFTDVAGMLERTAQGGPLSGGAPTSAHVAALVARADAGEEGPLAEVRGHGTALGEALRTLISVHDPSLVIIGGPYWELLSPHALPGLLERARSTDRGAPEVEIRSSVFGDDVGAIGAATLQMGRALSPATLPA